MGGSRCNSQFGIEGLQLNYDLFPARTPGPLGRLDASDPDLITDFGDTPGPLGIFDHADPVLRRFRLIPSLNFEQSEEYRLFEEMVLEEHVKKASRRRSRVHDILEADLDIVEGKFKLRRAVAAKCRALLRQARGDLDKEKVDFSKKPIEEQQTEERKAKANGQILVTKVARIGITSAYRSFEYDSALWHKYFRNKYYPVNYSRLAVLSCWEGGEHGWTAAKIMVDFVKKRKAAPGFSNHTNGIAVDFFTVEDGDTLQAETGKSDAALKTLNQRWEKSWLYRWLENHKNDYGIERIETEAWHWEFRK
jgi:LAS superfamily LD-carboxypeptidase LdcB